MSPRISTISMLPSRRPARRTSSAMMLNQKAPIAIARIPGEIQPAFSVKGCEASAMRRI
jgi:hypothetical protein